MAKTETAKTDEHGNFAEPVTMAHPEHWVDCEHEKTLDNGQPDTESPATKECNPTMVVTSPTHQASAARSGWKVAKPKTRSK